VEPLHAEVRAVQAAGLTVALLVDDSQAAAPAVQMIRDAIGSFIKTLDGKAFIR